MFTAPDWTIGCALAAAVSWAAMRVRALSGSGAVAATVLGTLAVGAGWPWGFLLIGYFVANTLLSLFRAAERDRRTGGLLAKGSRRDATQVFANGGVFGLAAAAYWMLPLPAWQWIAAGALAASAADTFATEIGTLSRREPRSVRNWQPVPPGTSGGVTLLGSAAAVVGAATVALLASLLDWPRDVAIAALGGGIAGAALDSVIGATIQERRWCTTCDSATEQRVHRCGSRTEHRGGLSWMNNDSTNAVSTVAGAVVGALLAAAIS